MGNYNSQYENYYRNLTNRRRNHDGYSYGSSNSSSFRLDKNYFLRRITRELIGVFVLFLFVIACKTIVTPETKSIYDYSKEMLKVNYDYNKAIATVKEIDLKDVDDKITNWMETAKSKLTGEKTIKDRIEQEFIPPVEGTISSDFGDSIQVSSSGKKLNEGIDIEAKIGSEVLCVSKGKVKECGENKELGKYIVIDHGEGIETKYGSLSEALVKNGDELEKGTVIAKTGNSGKAAKAALHFELMYMGENKNPAEYMSFTTK